MNNEEKTRIWDLKQPTIELRHYRRCGHFRIWLEEFSGDGFDSAYQYIYAHDYCENKEE